MARPQPPLPLAVRGVRIARLFGIDVVLDPSWVVSAAVLTVFAKAEVVQGMHPRPSESRGWLLAFAFAMGITLCILVHEFSHCFVARGFGLPVRQVRLFMLGGVSLIEREAPTPRVEFAVAVAGPLSSMLIAGVSALLMRAGHPEYAGALGGVWWFYAFVNMALAIFNLIPAFPMDGGRVLRSLLWLVKRDRARATRWAALAGRVFAGLLIAAGVLTSLRSSLTNDPTAHPADGLWFVFMGWYLYGAASSAGRSEGGDRPNVSPPPTLSDPRARILDRDDRR